MNNIFQRDLINQDLIRHDRPLEMDQPNISTDQDNTAKKNVIVLVDQESRHSNFLRNNLGMSVNAPFLCRMTVPTRVFNYEIFGLTTYDPKLDRFIDSMDGVIVIFELSSYGPEIYQRLLNLMNNNPNQLLMTIIEEPEYVNQDSLEYKQLFELFQGSENHKLFSIKNRGQQIPDQSGWLPSDKAKSWFNNSLQQKTQSPPSTFRSPSPPAKVPIQSPIPRRPQWTSRTIDISSMVRKFMDLTLDLDLWDHYGRLRIVHYSLNNYGFQNTINPQGWLCTYWKRYKTSIGHGHLWHYTLTRFWATILYRLINSQHYPTFDELYRSNQFLHQGKLFEQYYTPKLLFTDQARKIWVPPDLRKL